MYMSYPTLIHNFSTGLKSISIAFWPGSIWKYDMEVKLFCISHIIDGRVEIWPLYRESYDIRWQWIDQYIKIE